MYVCMNVCMYSLCYVQVHPLPCDNATEGGSGHTETTETLGVVTFAEILQCVIKCGSVYHIIMWVSDH